MQITKADMKEELESMPDGFDDEPTVIQVRDDEALTAPEPPALPFTLARAKPSDGTWLERLDPQARIILQRAMVTAPCWPIAPRVRGAVAVPLQKIPSLPDHA